MIAGVSSLLREGLALMPDSLMGRACI